MKKKKENYQVVATKVSNLAYERLNKIARKKGITIYEMIQMACDTFIRYMDERHNLTEDIERAMAVFEHMIGWRNAVNLADPAIKTEILEATYYLSAEGKNGVRAVHVEKPFFGNWKENENIQQIMERTIERLTPQRYRKLRALAVDSGCNSILDLLDSLIDQHIKENDVAAMRQDFEDADRSEYGKKPPSTAYKRHHKKDINMFDAVTDEEERRRMEESEAARQRLEETMPFKPFCCEW